MRRPRDRFIAPRSSWSPRRWASPRLLFVAGAALAGCGSASQPAAGCLGPSTTLRGSIAGWSKGAGYTLNFGLGIQPEPMATTPIGADGGFTLAVPVYSGPEALSAAFLATPSPEGSGWSLTSQATYSPQSLALSPAQFSVSQGRGAPQALRLRDASQPADGKHSVALYHYSADGVISGRASATKNGTLALDAKLDIHACAGWNWQLEHYMNSFFFEMSTPATLDVVYGETG